MNRRSAGFSRVLFEEYGIHVESRIHKPAKRQQVLLL
jgi:hypothetical protein